MRSPARQARLLLSHLLARTEHPCGLLCRSEGDAPADVLRLGRALEGHTAVLATETAGDPVGRFNFQAWSVACEAVISPAMTRGHVCSRCTAMTAGVSLRARDVRPGLVVGMAALSLLPAP
jgi:hypothetical protein